MTPSPEVRDHAHDVLAYLDYVDELLEQPDSYITGTCQLLTHTHPESDDCRISCLIHNPTHHSMSGFPTHWRADRGLMERICPHGVGHPDPDDIAFKRRTRGDDFAYYEAMHGCDGCCAGAYGDQPVVPVSDELAAVG